MVTKKSIKITSSRVDISDLDEDELEDVDYDDYERGEEIEKKMMTQKQFLLFVRKLKKDSDIDNLYANWKEGAIYYRFIKQY